MSKKKPPQTTPETTPEAAEAPAEGDTTATPEAQEPPSAEPNPEPMDSPVSFDQSRDATEPTAPAPEAPEAPKPVPEIVTPEPKPSPPVDEPIPFGQEPSPEAAAAAGHHVEDVAYAVRYGKLSHEEAMAFTPDALREYNRGVASIVREGPPGEQGTPYVPTVGDTVYHVDREGNRSPDLTVEVVEGDKALVSWRDADGNQRDTQVPWSELRQLRAETPPAGPADPNDFDIRKPKVVRAVPPPPQAPEVVEEVKRRQDPHLQHYKVLEGARYMEDGSICTLKKGQVIEDRSFNINTLRQNGVRLEPCDAPEIVLP